MSTSPPYNILFSAAGRRVSLLRHFRRTLDVLNIEGEILAADSGTSAPAAFVADRHVKVPRVSAPNYIDALVEACRINSVKLLFPLIDTDLVLLARHRAEFAAVGTTVVVSSEASSALCFDKNLTFEFFLEHDIDTPRVIGQAELQRPDRLDFPILVKPYDGSSGIGVTVVRTPEELAFFSRFVKHAMVQEYVVGQEYTIDVLVGFDGRIGGIVPRQRLEIRGGEVSKGLTVKSPTLMDAARKVVEAMPGALGCITVQCIQQADGRVRFIEINPRFGGGFPLSLHAGADFPRWLIEQHRTGTPTTYRDDWIDDLVMLRYDDEIVVRGEAIR